jgi:hypothetical protein
MAARMRRPMVLCMRLPHDIVALRQAMLFATVIRKEYNPTRAATNRPATRKAPPTQERESQEAS